MKRQIIVKRLSVLFMALLLLTMWPAVPARAQTVRVLVDGEPVLFDQPPVVIGGRVLVPLRGVFERLGAFVQWDPGSNVVTAFRGGTQVELQVGSRQASVDGRTVILDVPAMIVRGRTLVPLRFVSEAMGALVDWDAAARTVFITATQVGRVPSPPRPRPTVPPPAPPPAPPPPQASVVEGTVIRVDLQRTPQRIILERDGTVHTFVITADTAIRLVDVDTNRSEPINLDQIRAGDLVRVTVDAAGRAILVRVSVREISGRIDAITSRAIVLSDGRSYTLDSDVRFIVDGRLVSRDQLREGMEVTLRINPQTQQVIEVVARAPAPPPAASVRITAVSHNARDPLRAGETITVVLRGTPGGVATFDIFGVVADAPMREVAPGTYQGTYVVRSGDNVANAAVFGHLRVAGREAAIVAAEAAVTIDAQPPAVVQRSPEPNSLVNNARPNILVTYQDRGSGIDPRTIRLFVNGEDVTDRATVSESLVAYNPPAPLAGRVTVRLVLRDRAGNRLEDSFAFTIGAVQAALIRSVTVHPITPIRAGDVVNVTMIGEPGGQASFTIEGVAQNVPMPEATNQPGVYFGSFRLPAGVTARNPRVLVQLSRGDAVSRVEASARLTIVTALVPPPIITAPAGGTRVGTPLVIRGTAPPGHQVLVRVNYRGTVLLFNLQGTYGEVTTTADASGNWQVTLNQSVRVTQAELTITAITIDPAGRRSEPTVVRVVQG